MKRTEPYIRKMFSIEEWNNYGNKKGFIPKEPTLWYKYGKPYYVTKLVRDHKNDYCWNLAKRLQALFLL